MRPIRLTQTIAPASEPLTSTEAKAHLRITGNDEDTLIASLIAAARGSAEAYLNRQLVTATWVATYDGFPGSHDAIWLPQPPLVSVSSVTYLDTSQTSQTLSSAKYNVVLGSPTGYILPERNETWPSSIKHGGNENITVTYAAGYGAAAEVPADIKSAILLIVGDLFENREANSTQVLHANRTAQALLTAHRVAPVA